jgi:hexosaminidase
MPTRRSVNAALALVAGGAVLGVTVEADAAPRHRRTVNPRPQTIPALREWTGDSGNLTFTPASRIVREQPHDPALAATSAVLADDLKLLTGRAVQQVVGTPRQGDIVLRLDTTDTGLGTEGYALDVADHLTVTGRTTAGAFYGTRTVLQLLRQGTDVPKGNARDWPVKPERGLMVDCGRKYFTPDWFAKHVKELAYLKLNLLHLHLCDNQGFRIESERHPEFVAEQHLTKNQVTDLIALAARYHVTVVPEFDAPGHMDPILAAHPDLKLVSNTGAVNNGYIDLAKDGAYDLIADIYHEYLPLFPGPYFHIGADEYVTNYAAYPQMLAYAQQHYGPNATAKDTYLGFVNWANGIVHTAGKTTRAWNDGLYGGSAVTADANIVVEFWYNYGLSPQQHVDNGHRIANDSWTPTYYVLGGAKPDTTWGYQNWQPDLFQGNQTLAPASVGANLGSELHVWCDNPNAETEDTIAGGIKDPLRMVSQQVWGSPKLVDTWAEFGAIITAVGRCPGWVIPQPGNLAFGRPVTVSSTETPSFPGANAVDGEYGTRWSSDYSDPQWIAVDLGASHSISRVTLTWEAAYAKAYQIQTSADGTTWTTIYSTSSGVGGTDEITDLTGSGRYVRMYGTARATGYGYSLWEFEIYS